ncbi:MAG: TetR/AcrR family transcriptional regulator [Myxococcota bacterium]|nr:TetR/AcrR family transcriptional regulator [Myxococcota bacterium]
MTIVKSQLDTTDGRHLRSQRTRTAVAEAMLDCLEDGILRPSAKQIADRAGVSTRAVFRHFKKMELLIDGVAELQLERVMSSLPAILDQGSLEERTDALVRHSTHRNQTTSPVRRASQLSEPSSAVIQKRLAWLHDTARQQVQDVFADELARLSPSEAASRVAGIRALLSFGYWDELRRYEGQSEAATMEIIRDSILALFARSPG